MMRIIKKIQLQAQKSTTLFLDDYTATPKQKKQTSPMSFSTRGANANNYKTSIARSKFIKAPNCD